MKDKLVCMNCNNEIKPGESYSVNKDGSAEHNNCKESAAEPDDDIADVEVALPKKRIASLFSNVFGVGPRHCDWCAFTNPLIYEADGLQFDSLKCKTEYLQSKKPLVVQVPTYQEPKRKPGRPKRV